MFRVWWPTSKPCCERDGLEVVIGVAFISLITDCIRERTPTIVWHFRENFIPATSATFVVLNLFGIFRSRTHAIPQANASAANRARMVRMSSRVFMS